jgi:alkanesulfonate monooxygenase SsuD/methylene tetrahydromethanopterin reductase-like flavin-dependent oxidoreductase (luciferase family)
MDFGIVTAKVDEIGYIAHAENLGFSHAWVTDSPMIRSNCWAVLALAARATRTMRLGTGVKATCLIGTPEELVEQIRTLDAQGLRQIMLYPPLNRQYRVIEDFADAVMSRL